MAGTTQPGIAGNSRARRIANGPPASHSIQAEVPNHAHQ